MPTSAPGSRSPVTPTAAGARRARGFTLIELMIVVALVGLASSLVVLSIRDPAATRLEQEAARLAALLESARAESRASGLPVRWVPGRGGGSADVGPDFRFVGLPRTIALPARWLDPSTSAEISGGTSLLLGPEPIIGAQRIVMRLADQRLDLATDGLGPFSVVGAGLPLDAPP